MNKLDILKRAARTIRESAHKLPEDKAVVVLATQTLVEEPVKERVTFKDGGKLLIKE